MQTTHAIYEQLTRTYAEDADISLELLDGADPAINVTMHEYGDMGITVAASGEQIMVSTILAPVSKVKDVAGLNDACMRLNPINPLSNLGILTFDGGDAYVVFGELSAKSTIEAIDEEIRTLARNTIEAVDALKPYFH